MATRTKKKKQEFKPVSAYNWRTTDEEEIAKRRQRARDEHFIIRNPTPEHPVYSTFAVKSGSGLSYSVEVRDLNQRQFACDCVDFRINGLGTCKHVEAVLLYLQARYRRLLQQAARDGSSRIEVVVDRVADNLRVARGMRELPGTIRKMFDGEGLLMDASPEAAVHALRKHADGCPRLRISQEINPWLEHQRRLEERSRLRREYEFKVQSGEWPQQETTVALFPYQREGMLHLAFTERALLADEMGLGKTIQAIAASALLHRLGNARRVLVVTPASLKTEWEEQILRFTTLDYRLIYGRKLKRLAAYATTAHVPFFTIVNYEQMVADSLDVNERLAPDIVILDEAQRIKNWSTKTAQAIKRLRSRYAFILTGTPIENRIDEIHSLMDFLNPAVLGPLFRFNRDFYQLDERGRPEGLKNLDLLHQRVKPLMLRRRKMEVETELPQRTDRNHFVPLSDLQKETYASHEQTVMRLAKIAERRPLSKEEQDKLQRELAMMRMICDTNYILDPQERTCPKLKELERVLEECEANEAKVIVFSEWERMLEMVRHLCKEMGLGLAWHTGSVPQQRRRAEINAFKNDPAIRVFLSTDSGATGLNLQDASVVINCDLPWNPARLEQRIARAWRKHQTKPVTVINLISENTIEHRMLQTLALKQTVADSVLDHPGKVKELALRSGRQAFLERLHQLLAPAQLATASGQAAKNAETAPAPHTPPADPAMALAQKASERLQRALVRCEERYPADGAHSVLMVVVDGNAAQCREQLNSLHQEFFGQGRTDPLAPVRLEVVDRATEEAIERLVAAGLITRATRASRPLLAQSEDLREAPLSEEELAKARSFRERGERKLKMARVLGEGGLDEEARSPLLAAMRELSCALAVERRMPPPSDLKDIFRPPLSHAWATHLPVLTAFVENEAANWRPVAEALEKNHIIPTAVCKA